MLQHLTAVRTGAAVNWWWEKTDGQEFESWHRTLDVSFFLLIRCKMAFLTRPKRNEKQVGMVHWKNNRYDSPKWWFLVIECFLYSDNVEGDDECSYTPNCVKKLGYCQSWTVSIVLIFHKHNILGLGQIWFHISFNSSGPCTNNPSSNHFKLNLQFFFTVKCSLKHEHGSKRVPN